MIAKIVKKSNQNLVSLEEAKRHLRITSSHEDIYLSALLGVITTSIENEIGKDLVDTEYQFNIYDKLVEGEHIYFPEAPIYNVLAVEFFKGLVSIEGGEFTSSDEYIKFFSLPADYDNVKITYKKGFSDSDDVPAPIKQAALLMLTDLYQFRGTIVLGKSVIHIEKTVQRLLQPYKKVTFI